jgi:hypothetical protein
MRTRVSTTAVQARSITCLAGQIFSTPILFSRRKYLHPGRSRAGRTGARVNAETLSADLSALRNAMSTLLITHYFVTEEMRSELGREQS